MRDGAKTTIPGGQDNPTDHPAESSVVGVPSLVAVTMGPIVV